MKTAIDVDNQIEILQGRGVDIKDVVKAREHLLDIGFYRLGFYLFPFEEEIPKHSKRTHRVIAGTRLEDAVTLYYFDFDLRQILNRYLQRIEVAVRTSMNYHLSLKYKNNPTWFFDRSVVSRDFADSFEEKIYKPFVCKTAPIVRHHGAYPNDRFAPSWKTLEFMPFGSIEMLYNSLKSVSDKQLISKSFGINSHKNFSKYLQVCRFLRNQCAHGAMLYDLRLHFFIPAQPAQLTANEQFKLAGCLRVVSFMIGSISKNRKCDFQEQIISLYKSLVEKNSIFASILSKTAAIDASKPFF